MSEDLVSESLLCFMLEIAKMRVPPGDDQHVPASVTFREFGTPADVCWGCSDPDTGLWVPVTQCPEAVAAYEFNGGPVSYPRVDDVQRREDELDDEYESDDRVSPLVRSWEERTE